MRKDFQRNVVSKEDEIIVALIRKMGIEGGGMEELESINTRAETIHFWEHVLSHLKSLGYEGGDDIEIISQTWKTLLRKFKEESKMHQENSTWRYWTEMQQQLEPALRYLKRDLQRQAGGRICKFWSYAGLCVKGSQCLQVHLHPDNVTKMDSFKKKTSNIYSKRDIRSEKCLEWERGYCTFGRFCRYRHLDKRDLQDVRRLNIPAIDETFQRYQSDSASSLNPFRRYKMRASPSSPNSEEETSTDGKFGDASDPNNMELARCSKWYTGICLKGRDCPDLHLLQGKQGVEDLRKWDCPDFAHTGACMNGKFCNNVHFTSEEFQSYQRVHEANENAKVNEAARQAILSSKKKKNRFSISRDRGTSPNASDLSYQPSHSSDSTDQGYNCSRRRRSSRLRSRRDRSSSSDRERSFSRSSESSSRFVPSPHQRFHSRRRSRTSSGEHSSSQSSDSYSRYMPSPQRKRWRKKSRPSPRRSASNKKKTISERGKQRKNSCQTQPADLGIASHGVPKPHKTAKNQANRYAYRAFLRDWTWQDQQILETQKQGRVSVGQEETVEDTGSPEEERNEELLSMMLEDKDEKEQRLIEERRKKREAILAKHAQQALNGEAGGSPNGQLEQPTEDVTSGKGSPSAVDSTAAAAARKKSMDTFDMFSTSPNHFKPCDQQENDLEQPTSNQPVDLGQANPRNGQQEIKLEQPSSNVSVNLGRVKPENGTNTAPPLILQFHQENEVWLSDMPAEPKSEALEVKSLTKATKRDPSAFTIASQKHKGTKTKSVEFSKKSRKKSNYSSTSSGSSSKSGGDTNSDDSDSSIGAPHKTTHRSKKDKKEYKTTHRSKKDKKEYKKKYSSSSPRNTEEFSSTNKTNGVQTQLKPVDDTQQVYSAKASNEKEFKRRLYPFEKDARYSLQRAISSKAYNSVRERQDFQEACEASYYEATEQERIRQRLKALEEEEENYPPESDTEKDVEFALNQGKYRTRQSVATLQSRMGWANSKASEERKDERKRVCLSEIETESKENVNADCSWPGEGKEQKTRKPLNSLSAEEETRPKRRCTRTAKSSLKEIKIGETQIRKYFPQYGWYNGTIIQKQGKLCRIVYSDSDSETLPIEDVQDLIVDSDDLQKQKGYQPKQSGRKHKRKAALRLGDASGEDPEGMEHPTKKFEAPNIEDDLMKDDSKTPKVDDASMKSCEKAQLLAPTYASPLQALKGTDNETSAFSTSQKLESMKERMTKLEASFNTVNEDLLRQIEKWKRAFEDSEEKVRVLKEKEKELFLKNQKLVTSLEEAKVQQDKHLTSSENDQKDIQKLQKDLEVKDKILAVGLTSLRENILKEKADLRKALNIQKIQKSQSDLKGENGLMEHPDACTTEIRGEQGEMQHRSETVREDSKQFVRLLSPLVGYASVSTEDVKPIVVTQENKEYQVVRKYGLVVRTSPDNGSGIQSHLPFGTVVKVNRPEEFYVNQPLVISEQVDLLDQMEPWEDTFEAAKHKELCKVIGNLQRISQQKEKDFEEAHKIYKDETENLRIMLKTTKADCEMKCEEKKMEITRIWKQLEASELVIAEKSKKIKENEANREHWTNQIATFEQKFEALTCQIAQLQPKDEECKMLLEKNEKLETKLCEKQRQLDVLHTEHKAAALNWQKKFIDLQKQLKTQSEESKAEISRLSKQIEEENDKGSCKCQKQQIFTTDESILFQEGGLKTPEEIKSFEKTWSLKNTFCYTHLDTWNQLQGYRKHFNKLKRQGLMMNACVAQEVRSVDINRQNVVGDVFKSPVFASNTLNGHNSVFEMIEIQFSEGKGRERLREDGVDAGGLSNEFNTLFWEQLESYCIQDCKFNGRSDNDFVRLFEKESEGSTVFLPKAYCDENNEPYDLTKQLQQKFELIGRFLLRAFMSNWMVPSTFASNILLDYILNFDLRYSVKSLEEMVLDLLAVDPTFGWVQKVLQDENSLCTHLLLNDDYSPLKGEDAKNCLKQFIRQRVIAPREPQLKAISKGFYLNDTFNVSPFLEICSTPKELRLLISGEETFNVDRLWKIIEFQDFDQSSSSSKEYLRKVLEEMSEKELRLFLKFITGLLALPVDSSGEALKITVKPDTSMTSGLRFPHAQTCARQLTIPEYNSVAEMKARLIEAIQPQNSRFTLI